MNQEYNDDVIASSPQRRRSRRCWPSVVAYENRICATRTAWGYLEGKSTGWIGLWWLARHAIYFGLSIVLLLFVAGSSFFVVPFMIVAHVYKGFRGAIFKTVKQDDGDTVDDDGDESHSKDTLHSCHSSKEEGGTDEEAEEEIPV